MNTNLLTLNKSTTLMVSSLWNNINPIVLPNIDVPAFGNFYLGLGHHDNLTETKSWSGPKLKTSNTYWMAHLEFGPNIKGVTVSYFVSVMAPIPYTKSVSGYKHRGALVEHGPVLSMTLLSMKSKVNFTPLTGYRWLKETARIYDAEGTRPDSLNLKYRDHGPIFGLEFQFTLWKSGETSDHRLRLTYLNERLFNHTEKVHKFRIEWRFYDFYFESGTTEKINYNEYDYFSVGLEHVRWPDGRNDWFFIGSFGIMGK